MLPRIVLIVGPAGVGKSRLLAEAAQRTARPFADGIVHVDLATCETGDLLVAAVAHAFGVEETGRMPLLDALVAACDGHEMLLLLDNCAHLADATAALLETLAQAAPRLMLACTSREALNVSGALHFSVQPMAVPPASMPGNGHVSLEDLQRMDSVRLFCARAAAVRGDFSLTAANAADVARICRSLDGIPLALELAAAQMRLFTAHELAGRLAANQGLPADEDGVHGRHGTVRAALDWSYRVLASGEQRLLRRMGLFVGGATLEAIEAVVSDDELPASRVPPLLARLIDKSLVFPETVTGAAGVETTRYRMLGSVRAFAAEMLSASGEQHALRSAYCSYFHDLTLRAAEHFSQRDSTVWVGRVDVDYENIRCALGWSLESDVESAAQMVFGLAWYWAWRMRRSEAEEWCGALAAPTNPDGVRARALYALGVSAGWSADYERAYQLLAEAMGALGEGGTGYVRSRIRSYLAFSVLYSGRIAELEPILDAIESAPGYPSGPWELGGTLFTRGMLLRSRGQQESAKALLGEAAELHRRFGEPISTSVVLYELAQQHLIAGDPRAAEAHFRDCLALIDRTGVRPLHALALVRLAEALQAQGQRAEALQAFESGAAMLNDAGDSPGLIHLLSLAGISIDAGCWSLGIRLFAAAERALPPGFLEQSPEHALRGQQIKRATLAMNRAELMRAWREGAGLGVEEAIGLGLAELRSSLLGREPQAPPALELRMLGMSSVKLHGRQIELADWKYAKARDLLFYLVVNGERTREQIALEMWPDADAAAARNRLNVTLHYLRRALGDIRWVVYENGRYSFSPVASYYCDCDEFYSLIAQAEQIERHDPERAADLLARAAGLLRGDFLADITEGEWHDVHRRAHHRRALDVLLLLGRLRRELGQPREAIAAYSEAMKLDAFDEEVYRGLMRAHADRGDLMQILQVFRHMCDLFEDEYGAPPGPETLRVYRVAVQELGGTPPELAGDGLGWEF